jgi:hypothetical protein
MHKLHIYINVYLKRRQLIHFTAKANLSMNGYLPKLIWMNCIVKAFSK